MDRNRDYDMTGNYGYGSYGTYTTGTGQDQYQGSNWDRGQGYDRTNRRRQNTGQTGSWNQGMRTGMNRDTGLHVNQGTGNYEWSNNQNQGFGGYGTRQGFGAYGSRGYGQNTGYRTGRNYGSGYGSGSYNYNQDTNYGAGMGTDRDYGSNYDTGGYSQGRSYGTGTGTTGWDSGHYSRTVVTPNNIDMNRGQSWQGPHTGKGPGRSDERIEDDICTRLTDHPNLDASNVDVVVQNGEATLTGKVDSRQTKRMAEQVADSVTGVRDVHNELSIDESLLDKIENAVS